MIMSLFTIFLIVLFTVVVPQINREFKLDKKIFALLDKIYDKYFNN